MVSAAAKGGQQEGAWDAPAADGAGWMRVRRRHLGRQSFLPKEAGSAHFEGRQRLLPRELPRELPHEPSAAGDGYRLLYVSFAFAPHNFDN